MDAPTPTGVAAARQLVTFDAFYVDARPWALRLAHLLTGDQPLAEDLVQEAFTRVHRRFADLDEPGAYLRVCVVNACRSAHRSRVRERARQARAFERVEAVDPEVRELLDAVARLPYRQRAVIVLRYYADLPERHIADLLGCRPGTVKSLASRALSALQQEVPR